MRELLRLVASRHVNNAFRVRQQSRVALFNHRTATVPLIDRPPPQCLYYHTLTTTFLPTFHLLRTTTSLCFWATAMLPTLSVYLRQAGEKYPRPRTHVPALNPLSNPMYRSESPPLDLIPARISAPDQVQDQALRGTRRCRTEILSRLRDHGRASHSLPRGLVPHQEAWEEG